MYCDSSLCTLAFTQPSDFPLLLSDSLKAGISRAVNFNIDSLLLSTNLNYQLDIEGIHPRIDSAVSFTYDDNFNPVEKVVANTIQEPAFNFAVNGNRVDSIYNYWNRSAKLEKTTSGDLFTPIPFVKSYCSVQDGKTLFITSNNYKTAISKHTVECILFFKLLLTKIPPSILKYLPDYLTKAGKNIEAVEAVVNNEKGQIVLHVSFNKKKNDLPIIEW